MDVRQIRKPRCFLVYALAPQEIAPGEANRRFNEYVADRSPAEEREALSLPGALEGWQIEVTVGLTGSSCSGSGGRGTATRAGKRRLHGRKHDKKEASPPGRPFA